MLNDRHQKLRLKVIRVEKRLIVVYFNEISYDIFIAQLLF